MSFLIRHLCRSMHSNEHIFIFIIQGIMNIKTDLNSHGIKKKSMRIYCKFSLCAFLRIVTFTHNCFQMWSAVESRLDWFCPFMSADALFQQYVVLENIQVSVAETQSCIAGPQSSGSCKGLHILLLDVHLLNSRCFLIALLFPGWHWATVYLHTVLICVQQGQSTSMELLSCCLFSVFFPSFGGKCTCVLCITFVPLISFISLFYAPVVQTMFIAGNGCLLWR